MCQMVGEGHGLFSTWLCRELAVTCMSQFSSRSQYVPQGVLRRVPLEPQLASESPSFLWKPEAEQALSLFPPYLRLPFKAAYPVAPKLALSLFRC